ncbi:aspartate/glutamate racemase family protein [Rhodobacter sp. HX-7-19]|uniref:Hydantoin racemase n=1 Tax=Paragemmobacter kunshanensis TaxID=2583234 RepID=A0A6M1TW55_9RHOB|nr:aspartate/glutamate racemase family protein [Rhodobacter kunshanensis]NGQ90302.1 aspartate/glutamate racemase family protein [Rhodobacter kunshanensis]
MRIHVINPNSTAAMTRTIADAARAAASPGTDIDAETGMGTPPSIEGYRDEAMAVPALLAAILRAEARGADAHVIACFDDPGLAAAREVATGPVIGICQAALQVAMTISTRFSVITTLPRSVPVIEDLVAAYGAAHRCRRVRAVDMPVLALEADPASARARLFDETRLAMDEDRAEAIVLGCAGMTDLCDWLSQTAGIPVIDGVTAATRLAEALAGAGYRTSKAGAYAYPRDKSADMIAGAA